MVSLVAVLGFLMAALAGSVLAWIAVLLHVGTLQNAQFVAVAAMAVVIVPYLMGTAAPSILAGVIDIDRRNLSN